MTPQPRSRGGARETFVTVHAFSKIRGVSDTAIRSRVKDGTLIPAMVAGKINVRKANRILNDSTTKGPNVDSKLADARKRKLIAQATILQNEVAGLQMSYDLDFTTKFWAKVRAQVVETVMRIPDEVAFPSDMAGHPNAAADLIDDKMREVLTRLSEFDDSHFLADEGENEAEAPAVDLDTLTAVELATLMNNLKAEKLEIERRLGNGELVPIDLFTARINDAFLRTRGRLLAVGGYLAFAAGQRTEPLKDRLRAALAEALEELKLEEVDDEPSA